MDTGLEGLGTISSRTSNEVKFQNAFEYYEIMYNLYRNVLKRSIIASPDKHETVKAYYRAVKELYSTVQPFLEENSQLMVFKRAVHKISVILKERGLEEQEILDVLKLRKEDLANLHDLLTKSKFKDLMIYDRLNLIEKRLRNCDQYVKINARAEILNLNTKLLELLNECKDELFLEMKINSLTVPLKKERDPGQAILEGFS